MITNLLFLSLPLSAVALLWRIFSRQDAIKNWIEALPYILRKPLTCGVCFTFWFALPVILIFSPFGVWQPTLRWPLGFLTDPLIFFVQWFSLGMISVSLYYSFLTVYEVSHYFSHQADVFHQDQKSENKKITKQ